MSTIYEEKNDYLTALYFSNKSLDLAAQYGLKNEISEANLKLSTLYEKTGKEGLALKHYKNYITYRDSVSNINLVQQMANLRTEFEVSEKQIKVDLLEKEAHLRELSKKKQQYFLYGTVLVTILVAMLAFGLFRRSKFVEKTNRIIKAEKKRSDNLLLNILPRETAIELKTKGQVKAKKFDSVTVMFADFVSFTKHSEHMSPEELVKNVGFYFSEFDRIMEKHKLEKIKTLGDAYMCAGGLPFISKNHAERMILAAFDILEFVESVKKCKHSDHVSDALHCWDIRIGINSGPVVAGVVGSKKFAYDIWGDTVNIASRMQTASESGMINIGENTYELIKNQYDCTYRGELEVKNKGTMKMYYVKGKKETQRNTEPSVKSLLAVN
jgi:class 3 adenylate cyclase